MGKLNIGLVIIVSMILIGGSIRQEVTTDRVDLIEINHYYDDAGQPVLQQLIFYDWCASARRFQIRDFRLIESPQQLPHRVPGTDDYVVVWLDKHDGVRRVLAQSITKTYTRFDPEMAEREHVPMEQRRKLTPPLRKR